MWPFKKERDVDQLIFDCAEYKRAADSKQLSARLMQTELFAPVASGLPDVPDGTRYLVGAKDSIQLLTARIGNLNCVAFYTNRNDARLRRPFVSLTGKEAMQMVLKSNADGLVIQNNKPSYFGFNAQGIREALGAAKQD